MVRRSHLLKEQNVNKQLSNSYFDIIFSRIISRKRSFQKIQINVTILKKNVQKEKLAALYKKEYLGVVLMPMQLVAKI